MNNRDTFVEMLWRSAQENAPQFWVNDLLIHDRETIDNAEPGSKWWWIVRTCGTHLLQSRHDAALVCRSFHDVVGVYRLTIPVLDPEYFVSVSKVPPGILSLDTIPNINEETGIPYGVVSLNSLAEWVFDEFFDNGRDLTAEAIEEEALAENPGWDGVLPDDFWDDVDTAAYENEYSLEADGMKLLLGYLGGAPLVWVLESEHFAECSPCSPCVPNAGDLDSKHEGGMTCYDLPPEWYEQD